MALFVQSARRNVLSAEEALVAEFQPVLAPGDRTETTGQFHTLQFGRIRFAVGLGWYATLNNRRQARAMVRADARKLRRKRLDQAKAQKMEAEQGTLVTDSREPDFVALHRVQTTEEVSVGDIDLEKGQIGRNVIVKATQEQSACGYSDWGHQAGDYSLAAKLARYIHEEAEEPQAYAFFVLQLEKVWYVLHVRKGVISPGSDRCFLEESGAMHEFYTFLSRAQRANELDNYKLYLSESVDYYDRAELCERVNVKTFLAGTLPGELRPIDFQVSRALVMRSLAASCAIAALGGMWYILDRELGEVYTAYDALEELERKAKSLDVRMERILVEPVPHAPWEGKAAEAPSSFVARAVDALLAVPTAPARASAPAAPYGLRRASYTGDAVDVAYDAVFEAPRTVGGEPLWPASLSARWPVTASVQEGAALRPVALEHVRARTDDDEQLLALLREALVAAVTRHEATLERSLLHPYELGRTRFGRTQSLDDVAWVVQEVDFPLSSRPDRVRSLLEVLDALEGFQATAVAYLPDDEVAPWRVRGYVGGELDLLAEVRDLERRAREQEAQRAAAKDAGQVFVLEEPAS